MPAAAITETRLDGLTLVHRGKVRDVYEAGDALLIVATDRVSAYDCVLAPGIPDKGRILTSMSKFWFEALKGVVPNHVITTDVDAMPAAVRRHADVLRGRSMFCRRLAMFPVECVVRGYLTGSGWKDYRKTGVVAGHRLPPGLPESVQLDPVLYTPSTKEAVGHDITIDFDTTARMVGAKEAAALRDLTVAVFRRATQLAEARGILIADTKLEFGRDADGTITLGDEVLTPDSSRFWPVAQWKPGSTPPSFDKQPVRDYLETLDWDKTPPPPSLPKAVVDATSTRYVEAYERITGRTFADWPGVR